MVPSAAIAWYRYHRYPLFQIFPVIILKPVSEGFLKAPLKLITAVLQLLTTDIRRNLEFLYSRRTDTHWRTKKHGSSSHRHDNPVRNIRYKLSQSSYLLHCLYYMLNSISRLEATVIQLNTMLMMLQSIQHEAHQFLYIDTSLDGILSAWVSKLMTTDSPIQSGEVTILTLSEYHTRTNDGKLTMISFASLSPITTSANFGLQFNCFLLCTIIYNHGAKVRNFI